MCVFAVCKKKEKKERRRRRRRKFKTCARQFEEGVPSMALASSGFCLGRRGRETKPVHLIASCLLLLLTLSEISHDLSTPATRSMLSLGSGILGGVYAAEDVLEGRRREVTRKVLSADEAAALSHRMAKPDRVDRAEKRREEAKQFGVEAGSASSSPMDGK